MKRFIILFAILFSITITGVANAASIAQMVDPKVGPELWLVEVYNNDTATIDVGDVVIWDIGASTGDNDNYVNVTTTADTYLVAGVVYPADILTGETGSIAIRGPVQVDVLSGCNTVGGLACSSTTDGSAKTCDLMGASFGIVTQAASGGSAIIFVDK